MDRGAWWAPQGVTKSRARLSTHACPHDYTHTSSQRGFAFQNLLQMIATATVLDLRQNFSHFSHGFQEIQKAKDKTNKQTRKTTLFDVVSSYTAWQTRS